MLLDNLVAYQGQRASPMTHYGNACGRVRVEVEVPVESITMEPDI